MLQMNEVLKPPLAVSWPNGAHRSELALIRTQFDFRKSGSKKCAKRHVLCLGILYKLFEVVVERFWVVYLFQKATF
eukprot:3592893-Amphidinium_carterae.1